MTERDGTYRAAPAAHGTLPMTLDELLSRTLLLDVETTRAGMIRKIGAVLDGRVVVATTDPP